MRDVVGMAEAVRAAEARVAVEREAAAKAEKARAAEAMEAEPPPAGKLRRRRVFGVRVFVTAIAKVVERSVSQQISRFHTK